MKKLLYVLLIVLVIISMFALVKMTENPGAISEFGKESLEIGDVVN